ncbi:MAG: nucleotidyltransferase family protein [Caldilineaceae bacterium]|nr:nucleotidyltransferase family protein [Caldilineaceae bacterium]
MSQTPSPLSIAAIVAAAGRSTRMGTPKQLLPWQGTTVLAAVVRHLDTAGAQPVVCVVGHRRAEMVDALAGAPALIVDNPGYLQGEMLSSYQTGVRHLQAADAPTAGALLALGDQPHIPVTVLETILCQARQTPDYLVIPRYGERRGHPIYLPAALWPELLALGRDETLRTLVVRHAKTIVYVAVESDAILRDIDTPSDYQALAPSTL